MLLYQYFLRIIVIYELLVYLYSETSCTIAKSCCVWCAGIKLQDGI
jgi:hypothetical protein